MLSPSCISDEHGSIGFQNWISNWSRNGWVNSSKEPVKNVGIIRYISALLDLRAKSGQKVRLQYVKGHSGDTGNDGADAQANQGTTQPPRGELDWAAMEKELRKKIELEWHAQEVEDAVPVEVVSLEDNAAANKVLPRLRRRTVSPRRAETPSPQKKQVNSPRILESPVESCSSSSHAPQTTQIKQDNTARLSPLKAPLRASTVAPPVPVNKEDFNLDRGTMSLQADETFSPKKKEASLRRFLQMEAALKSPPHSRSLSSHAPLAAQIKQDGAEMMPSPVAPLKASSVVSPPALVEKRGFDPDRRTISPRPVEVSPSQKKLASLHRILEIEAALKPPVQSRPLSSHAQATQDDTTKFLPSMTTVRSSSVVSAPVSVNKEDLDPDVSSLLPRRFCVCLNLVSDIPRLHFG